MGSAEVVGWVRVGLALDWQAHWDIGGFQKLPAGTRVGVLSPCPHPGAPQILLLAMKDMNVAKLTSGDLPLFTGIIQDLFPGIESPTIDYGKVCAAVLQRHLVPARGTAPKRHSRTTRTSFWCGEGRAGLQDLGLGGRDTWVLSVPWGRGGLLDLAWLLGLLGSRVLPGGRD